jgi:nucleoside-diphosphate-sugar epimerase
MTIARAMLASSAWELRTMTSERMDRTALVIGATGGIGSETAKALLRRGWRVRALTRDTARAERNFVRIGAVQWLEGDAMRESDVVASARGVSLIVHAANPPGYRDWRGLALPMLRHAIAGARAAGARIVLPGNLYNYGPNVGDVVAEDAPQHPATRKGRVRVEMEALLAAAAADGVHSLVIRAGDYFGPHGPSSWFGNVMVRSGRPVRFVIYPGRRGVGHSFAYLPDLAEAIARLAEIEATLAPVEVVHFAGHWLERGEEIAEAIRRVAGVPRAPILPFPALLLYLGAIASPTLREAIEMRYLWQKPLRLDNRKLVSLIGPEPHTPLDAAVRASLEALGCEPPTLAPDRPQAASPSL